LALTTKKKDIITDEKKFESLEFEFNSSLLLEYGRKRLTKDLNKNFVLSFYHIMQDFMML